MWANRRARLEDEIFGSPTSFRELEFKDHPPARTLPDGCHTCDLSVPACDACKWTLGRACCEECIHRTPEA